MRARVVKRLVEANNRLVRRVDGDAPNPWPVEDEPWARALRAAHGEIRAEWDAFVEAGHRLPLIDDLLDGPQGNDDGWWQAGGLITRRRARGPLAALFPRTVEAFCAVPGLLSAMVSVLGPGAELRTHVGDNAGALNVLYGVKSPSDAGHEIDGRPVTVGDGDLVIFDDTHPHAAWNRSDQPRVLIIGDLLRPLAGPASWVNGATQWTRHHLSPGYSRAIGRGTELHEALNG